MKIVSCNKHKFDIISYLLSEESKGFKAFHPTVSSKCLRMPQIIP